MFFVNVDSVGRNYGYRFSLNNSQGRFFFAQKGCDYSREREYLIILDKVWIVQKDKKGVLILMKRLFSERKALMFKFAIWNCCCLTRADK